MVQLGTVLLALAVALGVSIAAFVHSQTESQKTAAQQDEY